MASKDQIKKKKAWSTPHIIKEKIGDADGRKSKLQDKLNSSNTSASEGNLDASEGTIIQVESRDGGIEENKKDTGREKERSDTPSPPPENSTSQKEEALKIDTITSPAYRRKRSSSPFSILNKVEPLPSGSKDVSNSDSLASLRSGTPVKEAWTDDEEEKKKPGSASSRMSRRSKWDNKSTVLQKTSSQSDVLSVKSATAEQNAYIPYLYARGCIMRITEDMRQMKEKHIRIVHDIEAHYRSLEGESQTQFMAFVAKYRDKFSSKLDMFRHVIEQHRHELQRKDQSLQEEIQSLNERNTKLLQEKNEALSHSKEEMEKMDLERAALKAEMGAMVAGASELTRLHAENKTLKEEIARLHSLGSSEQSAPTSETKATIPLVAAAPVPIRGGGGSEEEDTTQWSEWVQKLQDEVTHLRLENAQLSASNGALQSQLNGMGNLAERYSVLENQYKALSLLAVASSDTKTAAEEQLEKTKEDEIMMREEQAKLVKEIEAWEKKFTKKNGRAPTEDDRPESLKELYVQNEEANNMLNSLEIQKETLTSLQSGVVPPAPEIAASPAVSEPDIHTVEVKVPDPQIVIALEASQQEVQELKLQLEEMGALGGAAIIGGAAVADNGDRSELDAANAALLQEQAAHDNTKVELETVQKQLEALNENLNAERAEIESKMEAYKSMLEAMIVSRDEKIASLKSRNDELEEERLKNVPVDTAKEIKNLQNKIAVLENDKGTVAIAQAGVTVQLSDLNRKLQLSEEALETQKVQQTQLEEKLKVARREKDEAVRDLTKLLSRKEPGGIARQKSKVGEGTASRGDVTSLRKENQELNARIRQLEREVNVVGVAGTGGGGGDRNVQKRHEKILKELEKRYDMERAKNAKLAENLKLKEEEASGLQKTFNKKEAEVAKLSAELAGLGVAAKEGVEAVNKVKALEKENKKLLEENKLLSENFNSERLLRKKYYNMVEDMKGKIRVYCRARPLSSSEIARGNHSVLTSVDEYTVSANSNRGLKEFQYDQVFMEDSTQEQIFEDTNNLIQSAFDGYNVCIFAYGQTGSGKTFTMIGDSSRKFPGIAPRAFERIFELTEENKSKFNITVSVYMMELYNDRLIDLFSKAGNYDDEKMEIKKDKKGLVYVQGAVVKPAYSAKELNTLFEEGTANRHTASTKMNSESSRSHLILSIVMESENKTTGAILKGKLSLVDLAGSERVGKTGATAEQLKEAMSINKSLSALGDVISALSSEQSFIPYRNHKLTMLMQDSLGGNAKTLMFVNVSPADYNIDETVISLTYASRVKLITNDASKNADNKEISRLKGIIAKMKKGEAVDEEDD